MNNIEFAVIVALLLINIGMIARNSHILNKHWGRLVDDMIRIIKESDESKDLMDQDEEQKKL